MAFKKKSKSGWLQPLNSRRDTFDFLEVQKKSCPISYFLLESREIIDIRIDSFLETEGEERVLQSNPLGFGVNTKVNILASSGFSTCAVC